MYTILLFLLFSLSNQNSYSIGLLNQKIYLGQTLESYKKTSFYSRFDANCDCYIGFPEIKSMSLLKYGVIVYAHFDNQNQLSSLTANITLNETKNIKEINKLQNLVNNGKFQLNNMKFEGNNLKNRQINNFAIEEIEIDTSMSFYHIKYHIQKR